MERPHRKVLVPGFYWGLDDTDAVLVIRMLVSEFEVASSTLHRTNPCLVSAETTSRAVNRVRIRDYSERVLLGFVREWVDIHLRQERIWVIDGFTALLV